MNCFMPLSKREKDGVFNPFRTSAHEKSTMKHCLCIFNYASSFKETVVLPTAFLYDLKKAEK